MDTCKRMWNENQIGEIAKKNAAPAKLYLHSILMFAYETDYIIVAKFPIYSTSNEAIDTIDKLKAKLGSHFEIPAAGKYAPTTSGAKQGWTVAVAYDEIKYLEQTATNEVNCYSRTLASMTKLTINDTVTEV